MIDWMLKKERKLHVQIGCYGFMAGAMVAGGHHVKVGIAAVFIAAAVLVAAHFIYKYLGRNGGTNE